MASAAPDPDPQPPARAPLFAIPSDLECIELLRLWKERGATAVPSWIRPAEVYANLPSVLVVDHQPATAADGSAAWFLVTTVRHLGPKDQRICRVVTGGGHWKGEHSHPLVSLPDGVDLGSVRSLTYMVKSEDGKYSRTGHLMREYLLSGDAGRVAGTADLETALCVLYISPRDLDKSAARALAKSAAKARRDAAKAAKAQQKAADQAARADIKARRAAAKARRRASSMGQELAAVNAAVAASDPPPPPAAAAAATPPRPAAGPTSPPQAPPSATTPPQRAAAPTSPPQAPRSATSPISAASLATALAPALEEAFTLPPRRHATPSPPLTAQHQSSSPVATASSRSKRLLLLEVAADSFLMPGSCLSWNQVYQAQQVEDLPPFKKTKRVDCSGWYLLDARHRESLDGSPCATA